jgi:hypothetical protein
MPPRRRPAPRLLSSMGLLFVLAAIAGLVGFVAITLISKLT